MSSDTLDLLERVAKESKLTLEDAVEIGRRITENAYRKLLQVAKQIQNHRTDRAKINHIHSER